MTDSSNNLFCTLFRRLLDSVDVTGKKAFIDAKRSSNFRDIQPRKTLEYVCDGIISIRFCPYKETADMDIFINIVPTNVVSIKANLIFGSLFRRGI